MREPIPEEHPVAALSLSIPSGTKSYKGKEKNTFFPFLLVAPEYNPLLTSSSSINTCCPRLGESLIPTFGKDCWTTLEQGRNHIKRPHIESVPMWPRGNSGRQFSEIPVGQTKEP